MQSFEKKNEQSTAEEKFARCYREGRLDEARRICDAAFQSLDAADATGHLLWTSRNGLLELRAGRLRQALSIHLIARPYIAQVEDAEALGKYSLGLALTYKQLFEEEGDEKHLDRSLSEYEVARYNFESARNPAHVAFVDNNIGSLLISAGRPQEAHTYLDRARAAFITLGETARAAEVDDTRARAFLRQEMLPEAYAVISTAVSTLLQTNERTALEDALATNKRVLNALDSRNVVKS